jgi:antitoxin HicB
LLKYPAVVHKEETCFKVTFPDFPGCAAQGSNTKELTDKAESALSECIVNLNASKKRIPDPSTLEGNNVLYVNIQPEVAIPILLKKMRKEMNLSQKEVADQINVTYQAYQRLENVARFNPTIKTLQKVSKALGKKVTIDIV